MIDKNGFADNQSQNNLNTLTLHYFVNLIRNNPILMNSRSEIYKKTISLSIFTLLLLTGCGNRKNLLEEIDDFNTSVQVGTEAIATYYSSINEQELELYFLILKLNPNCEVGDFINYKCLEPDFKPPGMRSDYFVSPLKQLPIPLESIQARISILKELADYSTSLASLAGNDSPEKFQGNIKTLQARLTDLEKKFQALQKKSNNSENQTENEDPDKNISKKYLIPISNIIGVLGKIAIEEARWKTISKSIIEAEGSVNTILKSVGEDLDKYVLNVSRLNADARYTILIRHYNRNRLTFSEAQRAALLEKIERYKKNYDLISISKPSAIPNNLLEAHKSLVKLAKSDGSIKNIAELRAWLERFEEDVKELKDAVVQLSKSDEKESNAQE